ncbi:hypothetical protein ACMC9I_01720 [Deinococcota bacterium DY0809b]
MNHTRWIVLVFLFAVAWAMPLPQLYDQLAPKLETARTELLRDPTASLQALDDALNIFRSGAENVPEALSEGVVQALNNARIAVSRKSKADLEGQLWVVRGSLGKLMYEAMFQAVYKGNTDEALALLDRLIEITARTPDLKSKAVPLIQAGDIEGLRTLFERAYAEAMYKSLQLAQQKKQRASAYALTAKAYGLYLVVQDSPRVDNLARDYVDALAKLVAGDEAGFKQQTDRLIAAAQRFFRAAGPAAAAAPAQAPAPATEAAPQPASPQAQPAPAPSPAPAAPTAPAQAPAPAAAATGKPKIQAQVLVSPIEQLNQDMAFLIGDKKKAEKVARSMAQVGIYSYTDWRNSLYITKGLLATAQAYVSVGRAQDARRYMEYARNRYVYEIYPLVEAIDPKAAKVTLAMFEQQMGGVGLRTSDLTVLNAQLENVADIVLERPLGPWHDFTVSLQRATFGLPRAVFFILVGMLALFPLYLIYLTFGGRNIYWRLMGLAFFFLLLPGIIEGLSYLGDILATYGGVPQLFVLDNLSILQNIVAQLAWGALIFLVVVFATWGLRGIAIQFGLIQDRRQAATTVQTSADMTGERNPTLTSETIVEWDEEF